MTNVIEKKLEKFGIAIPEATIPLANYITISQSGNQLFISGQLPLINGKLITIGKVGAAVNPEQAKKASEACALNILAQLKATLGDLNRIKRVVKITVFVAVDSHFTDIPLIANGASDLFVKIFGEIGKHARSAIGVASLPMDAPVEVEAVIEI
ncbi:enamine deaminase RidA (YjgF/YER057c/UK114 family) [Bartonella fuyuanensis]|uniref:Enamine deaminase RidA (YjgF/YER057c/UK114 family) n=1 Tax=Bartonella fuyuanensis TaxID=1460968 RepID=A0A840DZ14_9HYPH|nr:RidA family protein [Bartonella fuyuanensis]MBB4076752.1 enamine deaminase RidA (YjgF/YER057c/UK114 family) [Bartonella fuyuanensis]